MSLEPASLSINPAQLLLLPSCCRNRHGRCRLIHHLQGYTRTEETEGCPEWVLNLLGHLQVSDNFLGFNCPVLLANGTDHHEFRGTSYALDTGEAQHRRTTCLPCAGWVGFPVWLKKIVGGDRLRGCPTMKGHSKFLLIKMEEHNHLRRN